MDFYLDGLANQTYYSKLSHEAIDKGTSTNVIYLDFAETVYLTKDIFTNYVNMV